MKPAVITIIAHSFDSKHLQQSFTFLVQPLLLKRDPFGACFVPQTLQKVRNSAWEPWEPWPWILHRPPFCSAAGWSVATHCFFFFSPNIVSTLHLHTVSTLRGSYGKCKGRCLIRCSLCLAPFSCNFPYKVALVKC